VDNTEELPTVISFCSGYAGIERGLNLAGVKHRVIAYVEIEAYAIANLVAKMEAGELDAAPIWSNLKTFPAHLFRGAVDIITGGYPCQPFSAAGKRAGADDPRHLWPFIRKHVQTIRPARCFFENVEGHISLGLSSVIGDLEEDSYRATWGIFSAREVGAPHQRKRVYILADSSRNGGRRELRNLPSENESIGKPKKHGKNSPCLPDDAGENARVKIMGDTQHDGLSTATLRGSIDSTSDHNAQRQNTPRKSTRAGQPNSGANSSASNELANSNIERSQRRLQGRCFNKERREKQALRCATECCDWGSWYRCGAWPPEPGLGRVVDGGANRVDRIRLLGNGVVPQTAAKAWQVLDARFNDE